MSTHAQPTSRSMRPVMVVAIVLLLAMSLPIAAAVGPTPQLPSYGAVVALLSVATLVLATERLSLIGSDLNVSATRIAPDLPLTVALFTLVGPGWGATLFVLLRSFSAGFLSPENNNLLAGRTPDDIKGTKWLFNTALHATTGAVMVLIAEVAGFSPDEPGRAALIAVALMSVPVIATSFFLSQVLGYVSRSPWRPVYITMLKASAASVPRDVVIGLSLSAVVLFAPVLTPVVAAAAITIYGLYVRLEASSLERATLQSLINIAAEAATSGSVDDVYDKVASITAKLLRVERAAVQPFPALERDGDQLGSLAVDTEDHQLWLAVSGRIRNGPFTSDDRELLDGIAAVAGPAIKGALQRQLLTDAAYTDSLTGLLNRAGLDLRLAALRDGQHDGGCALLYIDLDRFKPVNDTYGHAAGDELLKEVAARMRESLRDTDLLGRPGGDEFVAILRGVPSYDEAELVATRLLARVSDPYELDATTTVTIGASIGGVCFDPTSGDIIDQVSQRADELMYDVKAAGRNAVRLESWAAA